MLWNIKIEARTWSRRSRQCENERLRGNRKHLHNQTQKMSISAETTQTHCVLLHLLGLYVLHLPFSFPFLHISSVWNWIHPQHTSGWLWLYMALSPSHLWAEAALRSFLTINSIRFSGRRSYIQYVSTVLQRTNPSSFSSTPLVSYLWCLLTVYAGWCLHVSGSQLKASPWLGCTQ